MPRSFEAVRHLLGLFLNSKRIKLRHHRRVRFEALEGRRLLAIGDLDTTFGQSGHLLTDLSSTSATATVAYSVAVQADGKSVAVGEGSLVRYLTDGSLDPTFGTNGIVAYPFAAKSVALSSTGQIVIAGGTTAAQSNDFVVSRYLPNGTLDTTFDADGHATIHFGAGVELANSVAVQANGRIVVAGSSDKLLAVARLLPNGQLDTSFDTDGRFTRQIYSTSNTANSVVLQPDGKILVMGTAWEYSSTSSNHDAFVLRLNTSGSIDRTFDLDGISIVNAGRFDDGRDMSLLADGKIVVSGYTNLGFRNNLLVARLNSNGALDSSFNNDGIATEALSGVLSEPIGGESHLVRADGSTIVSAGGRMLTFDSSGVNQPGEFRSVFGFQSISDLKSSSTNKAVIVGRGFNSFAVGRIDVGNQSLDTTFSGDGIVLHRFGPSDDIAGRSAVQSDGKILLTSSSSGEFAIARFNTNGSRDNSFSQDGIVKVDFGNLVLSASAKDVIVQPDQRIVVVGSILTRDTTTVSSNTDAQIVTVRLNTDGSLDTTFGVGGIVKSNLNGYSSPTTVRLQTDGRILVGGQGNGGYFTLLRYLPNGSLDNSFSGDGILTIFNQNVSSSIVQDLLIQPDGKIVVAGELTPLVINTIPSNMIVIRLNSNGTLDSTFGTNGRIASSNVLRAATAVLLASDGSIIVGGNSTRLEGNNLTSQMAIARYTGNGQPIYQKTITPFVETYTPNPTLTYAVQSNLTALALQPNGRIVVSGIANKSAAVLRYNLDGSEDTSFSGDGKNQLPLPSNGFYSNSDIFLQPLGRIVLVGAFRPFGAATHDLILSRVNGQSPASPSTNVFLNQSGQIEVRDLWSKNDSLRVQQVGSFLEIRDFSSDSNASFSVTGLPSVVGVGTKAVQIPLSLIQQTGQPLLINTLGGDDAVVLTTAAGDDTTIRLTFSGGAGNDRLTHDTFTFSTVWNVSAAYGGSMVPSGFQARTFFNVENLVGSASTDEFFVSGSSSSNFLVIDGTSGNNDSMKISSNANMKIDRNSVVIDAGWTQTVMFYNVMNATLQGGVSNNTLDARDYRGSVVLRGGAGNDLLYGGAGADQLFGDQGNDSLFGGDGNDNLYGGDGNDFLSGDHNDDFLFGGNHNDILIGGYGADTLRGGARQDILIAGVASGLTYYDTAELRTAVLDVWRDQSRTLEQRIDQLQVVGVGSSSYKLVVNVNVFSDFSFDQLYGEAERDWFFAKLNGSGILDAIVDLDTLEKVSPLP